MHNISGKGDQTLDPPVKLTTVWLSCQTGTAYETDTIKLSKRPSSGGHRQGKVVQNLTDSELQLHCNRVGFS